MSKIIVDKDLLIRVMGMLKDAANIIEQEGYLVDSPERNTAEEARDLGEEVSTAIASGQVKS